MPQAGEAIIGGRAATDYTRHFVFVFDNTYSTLRPKKCVHRVQFGAHLTVDDESVLLAPDVLESPYSEEHLKAAASAGADGQLATLSALLDRAKDSYAVVLDRARQAGEVSYGQLQGGIGVVQGGIVVAAAAPVMIQVSRSPLI